MEFKYKKWKIKWQKGTKKFKRIKRDRKKSRDAFIRWRRNKGKMMAALRKSKMKRGLANKKNKARGIYKKLSVARKRWKNVLKSDINLDNMLDGRLFLDESFLYEEGPIIDIEDSDIPSIIAVLKNIRDTREWEDTEDEEIAQEFIKDAITQLEEIEDAQDLFDNEEEFLEELIAFIEEYGEDIGEIEDDDDEHE